MSSGPWKCYYCGGWVKPRADFMEEHSECLYKMSKDGSPVDGPLGPNEVKFIYELYVKAQKAREAEYERKKRIVAAYEAERARAAEEEHKKKSSKGIMGMFKRK